MPGARLIIHRRARAPLRPRRGRHGGSRPAGRADTPRSRILGPARSARPARGRSPGRTRRRRARIDAQRPAERPQQAHDLRRGGKQRHHLRIAQQMRQLSAVTDRLRTRQPDEPGEIPRQTLRRRLRRVGFRLSRHLGRGRARFGGTGRGRTRPGSGDAQCPGADPLSQNGKPIPDAAHPGPDQPHEPGHDPAPGHALRRHVPA